MIKISLAIAIVVSIAVAGLAAAPSGHAAGHGTVVKTRHGPLGTFLVDRSGRTLYLFRKDRTRKSRCYGACAMEWPPLTTQGRPRGEGSARKALLGTSRRADGSRQVTYKGHPLYLYLGDRAPGDTNGHGIEAFGARWYAVASSGRRIGARY